MIIKSIELENFRSYYGIQKFNLSTGSSNTTFIWAANNVGKTNLLNSITWCLHKLFTASFKKTDDLLNHEAEKDGVKKYSVTINFEENEKEYTAKRIGGAADAFHVHEISEDGDHKKVEASEMFINSIIPKEMMKYFVIDGEGDAVTGDASGQISVERSVRDILGTLVGEKAIEDLKYIKKETSKELITLRVDGVLASKQREFDSIDDSLEKMSKTIASLKEALEEYQGGLVKVEKFLKESNHEVVKIKIKQRNSFESALIKAKNSLKNFERKKIELIRKYSWIAFSDTLTNEAIDFIDENEFKGTIPAPFNETLVRDILEEKSCICGANVVLGSEAYDRIHSLLSKAADPNILNRIGRARSQLQVIKSHENDAKESIKDNYDSIDLLVNEIKSIKNNEYY